MGLIDDKLIRMVARRRPIRDRSNTPKLPFTRSREDDKGEASFFTKLIEPTSHFIRNISRPEAVGLLAGGVIGLCILIVVWALIGDFVYETRFILKFYLCSSPLGVASVVAITIGAMGLYGQRFGKW